MIILGLIILIILFGYIGTKLIKRSINEEDHYSLFYGLCCWMLGIFCYTITTLCLISGNNTIMKEYLHLFAKLEEKDNISLGEVLNYSESMDEFLFGYLSKLTTKEKALNVAHDIYEFGWSRGLNEDFSGEIKVNYIDSKEKEL